MPVPDLLGFDEVRLPEDVARGVTVRREFSTAVFTGENGREQRQRRWSESRRSYAVSFQVWDPARWRSLVDFHAARYGMWRGFRLRDPSREAVGYEYAGMNAWAVTTPEPFAVGNGSLATFPLSMVEGGRARLVTKVASPTGYPPRAYVNGVETAATFDMNAGTVTFAGAPPNGAALAWAGFYDVPVRFDADRLEATFQALVLGRTSEIPIVEIQV